MKTEEYENLKKRLKNRDRWLRGYQTRFTGERQKEN